MPTQSPTGRTPRSRAVDTDHDLPPFPGFDKPGLKFLKELAANNNREWLTPERKAIYKDHLQEPMKLLLGELRHRFREDGLPFAPDPASGIFRLYRDTRFAKDKPPYKTNIGAAVPFASESREGIGNYIHIEPGGCFYGGGAYFLDSSGLRNLRAAIDTDHSRFREILRDVEETIGTIQGEKLKRGPAGYPKDHPALDLLLYTSIWTAKKFPDSLATSRELVDWIVSRTRELTELNSFLYKAIRGVEPAGIEL